MKKEEDVMNQYRTNQILRVAKMYYELGMSQIEIAKKEHYSKSTVSRLIKLAQEMGLVKITISEPTHSFSGMEDVFLSRWNLKKVTILPDVVGNKEILYQDICTALSDDLVRLIPDQSVVGVAWGETLSTLATLLPDMKRKDMSVIQLNGGFSNVSYDTGASYIVQSLVDHLNAQGYLLPAPSIVDTIDIAQAITQDRSIKRIFTMAKDCQTAIYSLGRIGHHTVAYQMGYFTDKEYEKLADVSVGDICSHYVDQDGKIADSSLDARTVAVPLKEIQKIPNKFVAAVGKEKTKIILACLRANMVDYLYIDQPTAKAVLQLDDKK